MRKGYQPLDNLCDPDSAVAVGTGNGDIMGDLIHILLVIANIMVLENVIQWKRDV